MKASIVAVIVAVLAVTAFGEVTPIVVHLPDTTTEYVVPTGKVLLVDSAQITGQSPLNCSYARLELDIPAPLPPQGSVTTVLKVPDWWNELTSLATPLRLTAGTTVRIGPPYPTQSKHESRVVTLFCRLCDKDEMYAALDCEFFHISEQTDVTDMGIYVGTAAPVHMKLECSDDLLDTWRPLPGAQTAKDSDPLCRRAYADCNETYHFYRAIARRMDANL